MNGTSLIPFLAEGSVHNKYIYESKIRLTFAASFPK